VGKQETVDSLITVQTEDVLFVCRTVARVEVYHTPVESVVNNFH